MPKLPRVSGAEIVRALERLGFAKVRQSGSNVVMRLQSKECVIPLRRGLKFGTPAGVLRPTEVSGEEFIAVLRV